jgi:hypothetical protein
MCERFEDECFLCCKHSIALHIILFRPDCHYGLHVHRYVGRLPCYTTGHKQCHLATRWVLSTVSKVREAVPEPNIPVRWICRVRYIPWPPRSPDFTHMDFTFWGFKKDNLYTLPMLASLQELRDRIANAIVLANVTFLNKLWGE